MSILRLEYTTWLLPRCPRFPSLDKSTLCIRVDAFNRKSHNLWSVQIFLSSDYDSIYSEDVKHVWYFETHSEHMICFCHASHSNKARFCLNLSWLEQLESVDMLTSIVKRTIPSVTIYKVSKCMMFQNLLRFEVVYSIAAFSLGLEHKSVTVFVCFASGRPSPWLWWRRFRLLQCCWVASSCWPVYHGCCGQHWALRHYGNAVTSCSRSVTACMQSWTLCVSVRHIYTLKHPLFLPNTIFSS